jgi:hypothetical protein
MKHEDCVKSLMAEKYILGELSEGECGQFEQHFFECLECAGAVRTLLQLQDGTKAALSSERAYARSRQSAEAKLVPSSSLSKPNKWFAWWVRPQAAFAGALAATVIAVVTSYQNVQLRDQLHPQAIHSVLLQPATRGEIPALSSSNVGTFVLLEADLPAASGTLTWSLQANDGRIAAEGTGPAPEAGLSFKVLVPGARLGATEYKLVVRSEVGKEWVFPFRKG